MSLDDQLQLWTQNTGHSSSAHSVERVKLRIGNGKRVRRDGTQFAAGPEASGAHEEAETMRLQVMHCQLSDYVELSTAMNCTLLELCRMYQITQHVSRFICSFEVGFYDLIIYQDLIWETQIIK